jgi:hypothetical protein
MSAKTYLRFIHKIDVYQKTTATSAAGQKTITFSKAATIPAIFQAQKSERRIEPYIDNIDQYEFYISYQDAQYITYNNRIQNVVDRFGNVLETGPLEIVSIRKYMGYKGKLHHYLITTRRVVENV